MLIFIKIFKQYIYRKLQLDFVPSQTFYEPFTVSAPKFWVTDRQWSSFIIFIKISKIFLNLMNLLKSFTFFNKIGDIFKTIVKIY